MKLFVETIRKLFILVFSSGASLAAGGIVATLVITLMYHFAEDGPIFPAPLVALVVVAPVSYILFVIHGVVLTWEWISQRRFGNFLLWIGLAGGLAAGLGLYFVAIAPYQSGSDNWGLFAFGGLGILQGLVQFGCHWVANKLKITAAWQQAILSTHEVKREGIQ